MDRFLPRTSQNTAGFTLVELMVVMAIIAVLSVVGMGVYSGIQSNARDARRREELDSIVKALEINKSSSTYQKITASQFQDGNYPGGGTEAKDPKQYPYCISTSSTIADADIDPTKWTSTACPPSYEVIKSNTPSAASFSEWKVCTRLENRGSAKAICKTNSQ
jgi:prepilin-type N-terminal cleavage/methylation domain-containing protein